MLINVLFTSLLIILCQFQLAIILIDERGGNDSSREPVPKLREYTDWDLEECLMGGSLSGLVALVD